MEPQKRLKSFAFTALLKDFNGKLIWLVFSPVLLQVQHNSDLKKKIGSNLICILFCLSFTHAHIYMQSTDANEELHVNIIHVCCSTVLGIFSRQSYKTSASGE